MRYYWRILLLVIMIGFGVGIVNKPKLCFPENDLYIPYTQKSLTQMSEETFNHVIDVVEEIYEPIIDEKGGILKIERKWKDGTVNAYAQRKGKVYSVSMFGGLARHEVITPDAFAYVVCHEVGHHLGGAPKIKSWFNGSSWASNEGQSDYWGGNKCLKRVFEVLEENSLDKEDPDYRFALAECGRRYNYVDDKKTCIRTAMAGKSLARLFKILRKMDKDLHFYTRDKKVVSKTYDKHPKPQCRMDTYLSSALCQKSYDEEVSQSDPEQGVCTRKDGFKLEARPLCWYKPKE